MKTVNIKGKEYVEVNERLKFFRSEEKYKDYSLESEIIKLENGVITIKATIKDGNGNIKATGLAQEKESSSFINKTSFVENCETSAWGRALGNLGIGIDTLVATAEEVQNAINNQPKTPENPNNTIESTPIEDIDIIEGLKSMDTAQHAYEYYKEYENMVKNIKNFQDVYRQVYSKLKTKEKINAA